MFMGLGLFRWVCFVVVSYYVFANEVEDISAKEGTLFPLPFDVNQTLSEELLEWRGKILGHHWVNPTDSPWISQSSHYKEHSKKREQSTSSAETTHHKLCQHLFHKVLKTPDTSWPPKKNIPKDLEAWYTMGGLSEILSYYLQDKFNGESTNWPKWRIQYKGALPNTCGIYDKSVCDHAMKKHHQFIYKKAGAVFGSYTEWLEGLLLNNHYKSVNVTTIEYRTITHDEPRLTTLHPTKVAQNFINGTQERFDYAFSYSSFEHDGLGRYGDPLLPIADLESIARVRCLLKPGGTFFLGLPSDKKDYVVWNAHRIYGPFRLTLAFLGWKVIDILEDIDCERQLGDKSGIERTKAGQCQPIYVLRTTSTR